MKYYEKYIIFTKTKNVILKRDKNNCIGVLNSINIFKFYLKKIVKNLIFILFLVNERFIIK